MNGIRAVVFDIGETILCEDRMWADWAEHLGVRPAVLFAVLGSVIARRGDHREVFELLRPGFDYEREAASKQQAGTTWRLTPEDLYPDVLPCLQALKNRSLHIGVVGNQPESIASALGCLGLPIDFVTSSEAWGVAKPSPSFFARVAETCGLPPSAIAYVGDRLDNDVMPANAAGFTTVFIRRGPWGYLQGEWPEIDQADHVVESLSEIPVLFDAASTQERVAHA
jgi:FMN phosphatase YigB (HAD superfamily)